jgi:hypothetical protein
VAFPVTFESIVSAVQATVAAYRSTNGLPPLNGPDGVGTGTIPIGAEYLDMQLSPPCIWVVPVSERFGPKDRSGIEDGYTQPPPTRYYTTRHTLEAWCWGDEDPSFAATGNTAYSFDSTLELRREFVLGLVKLGDVPELGSLEGRWEQPSNEVRLGRLFVLTFDVKLGLDDDPYVFLPFATDSSSGVQVVTTIQAISPDGTSTEQMGTIIAPPA